MRKYPAHKVILIAVGLLLLPFCASVEEGHDEATLRTIILGLKHRASLLPAARGIRVRKGVTYVPDSTEDHSRTSPYRAVLMVDRFVQTESGYWREAWRQSATPDETSVFRHTRLREGDQVYDVLPRLPSHDDETKVVSDPWTDCRVHIYGPAEPPDEEGFLDTMGTARGSASFLAERIASRSPELLGREEVNGLQCYVVKCSEGDVSTKYCICPEKQFVVLKRTETEADQHYESCETARRLGSLAGVPVVTATSFTKRCRLDVGPLVVCAIQSTRFRELTACRGNCYGEALVASVMRTGVRWFHRDTMESGWIGPDPDLRQTMSHPQAAEHLIQEEMDTEFAITDELE